MVHMWVGTVHTMVINNKPTDIGVKITIKKYVLKVGVFVN